MRIGEHRVAADGRNIGRRHEHTRAEVDGLLHRCIDVRRGDVPEPVRRTTRVRRELHHAAERSAFIRPHRVVGPGPFSWSPIPSRVCRMPVRHRIASSSSRTTQIVPAALLPSCSSSVRVPIIGLRVNVYSGEWGGEVVGRRLGQSAIGSGRRDRTARRLVGLRLGKAHSSDFRHSHDLWSTSLRSTSLRVYGLPSVCLSPAPPP